MKELEDIILKYRAYAITHGAATLAGDYKVANKSHDKLVALVPFIRGYGKNGEVALALLAEDSDDAVACWAATHLLKVDEMKATTVLRRLAGKGGPIAFNAEMVLKQWRKGELVLP